MELLDDWTEELLETRAHPPREIELRARSRGREWLAAVEPGQLTRGRHRQDPRSHPTPDVELFGARDSERHDRRARPQRDERCAEAERADPSRRTADRPFGHLDEDTAAGDDGACGVDVNVDPETAPPDGQETADPPRKDLTGPAPDRRRGAAEEPRARLERQCVHRDERIHPAPVRRRDEQVAAALRQVLLP